MSPHPSPQSGIALLESLMATLIFSIGVLAVIGLQAQSIQHTSDARLRITANYVADRIIGGLWLSPNSLNASSASVAELPNGLSTVTLNGTLATIAINWTTTDGSAHSYTTITQILPAPIP